MKQFILANYRLATWLTLAALYGFIDNFFSCTLISWQHSDGMGGMVDGWVGKQWGGSDEMGGDTNNHDGTV